MKTLLLAVAVVLVLAGLAGTVLPLLPGAGLIFAGLLLAAWLDGFAKVGVPTLVLLAIMTGISFLADFVTTAAGAKRSGASRQAVTGGLLGLFAGLFFALPGLIIGPFIGAFLGELYARGNVARAGRAGFGTWLGLVFGMVLRLALGLGMVAVFVTAYLI